MRIIVQVRELVSSNVSTIVETATNPVKMLGLLRKEIEESDIALHGEISSLTRRKERALAAAKKHEAEVSDWSAKAKVAMDHDREDLARSALLAREDMKLRAQQSKDEAANCDAHIAEAKDALEQLGSKLEETKARLAEEQSKHNSGATGAAGSGGKDSAVDRRLDRISNLERRVDHALSDTIEKGKSNAAVDAEIAAMRRDSAVDAELEKLRKAGAAVGKATKKRKAG